MAETYFRKARNRLKGIGSKVDIRRWDLLGASACAIARQPDRTGDALPLAEDGVALDPLSRDAWRALALVREHGGDFVGACAAWTRAHLIAPEDADCRVSLALCQWRYAEWVDTVAERRKVLHEALDHLDAAVRLYDSSQVYERWHAEWWSAMCHWNLGEFAAMPSHLSRILAMFEMADQPRRTARSGRSSN